MFVRQWMNTKVVTVTAETTIEAAREMLAGHKIRRLPVVDEDTVTGIISPRDLEKVLPSILDAEGASEEEYLSAHTTVKAVMTPSPVTVQPDDTLVEAIRKMRKHKIDGLPVVEGMKLVGILSITDVLDAFIAMMTGGQSGVRFDLSLDNGPESFYKMMKVFQKQQKEILGICQHYGYSNDHHLVTLQIKEGENEELIDQLWQTGVVKIERVGPQR